MRAVFSAFFVAVLATVAIATPLDRQKRSAFGGFSGTGFPFAGAYAGAGFNPMGFYPYYGDGFRFPFMPIPMPVVPFPPFPVFKNWYEGNNVCKEEKIINAQLPEDDIPAEWKEGMPRVDTDFSHEQESCQGNGNKYVCIKRVMGKNGESQIKATKYECCHGFVRDPSGKPGCIESGQQNATGVSQGSNGRLTPNDPTYYFYTGNSGSSSSSMSSVGNLDKVPLQ